MNLENIKFDEKGLVVAIAQESSSGEILMQAFMNKESLKLTIETKKAHYYSRSRDSLWLKGETSSNFQNVEDIYVDCDGDSIILKIKQEGVACHTGEKSCFYRSINEDGSFKNNNTKTKQCKKNTKKSEERRIDILDEVYNIIQDRKKNPKKDSYTNYLLDKGIDKILKKVGEECSEVIIASKNNDKEEVIYEVSDLFYHITVLLAKQDITYDEVFKELEKRN